MSNTKEARIPFMGTYNSPLDADFDFEVEQTIESYVEKEEGNGFDQPEQPDYLKLGEEWYSNKLHELIDWRETHNKGAQCYTESLQHLLADEGVAFPIKFLRMTSPRQYNFETDHIMAMIDVDMLKALKPRIDREIFDKLVADSFTSRDGFSSFYDNDADALWDIDFDSKDCDAVQLMIFIEALCLTVLGEDYEMAVLSNMSECGDFSEALALDWDKMDEDIAEARQKREAERNYPAHVERCPHTIDIFKP